MQVGFICPDGEKVTFADCINKCRLNDRCATVSTLSSMAKVRVWKGKPSTTQLIQPTRIAYLRIICDYYVSPDDMVYLFIGTKAHKKLEGSDTKISLLEQYFEDEEMTGIADNYETEDGKNYLTDYKTWGAFAVAKALGMWGEKVPDPSGELYKTSGHWGKAGTPKMVKIFHRDPARADNLETELQLNRYRLFYEVAGFPIDFMRVQAMVRDGGTAKARDYGINRKLYMIPVKRLFDNYIKDYFTTKRDALFKALETNKVPDICPDKERWDNNNRCLNFCEVREFCEYGKQLIIPSKGLD